MAEGERDSTQDWILPAEARPPTLAELEQRVDYAIAVAHSSEAAALEIGAVAIDAAEQARRAAELAERASAASGPAAEPAASAPTNGSADFEPEPEPEIEQSFEPEQEFDSLRQFSERADRVAARLRAMAPVA